MMELNLYMFQRSEKWSEKGLIMMSIENQRFRRCFRCLGLGVIVDSNNPEASEECDVCFGEGKIGVYNDEYRGLESTESKTVGSKTSDKGCD
jgi:hypothetical protein